MGKLINNAVVERNYKNTSSNESVDLSKVNPPFKVIDGKIVHATHDGEKWVW